MSKETNIPAPKPAKSAVSGVQRVREIGVELQRLALELAELSALKVSDPVLKAAIQASKFKGAAK